MKCWQFSFLLCLFLSSYGVTQTKPVESTKPSVSATLPEVPANYQDQFKTLLIKQKNLIIDERAAKDAYDADQAALTKVNSEGQALEAKILGDLKLDPKKYTTTYNGEKVVVVEKQEKK